MADFRGCGSIFSPKERKILKDIQGKRWRDRNREKVREIGRKSYYLMKARGTVRRRPKEYERERSRRRRLANPEKTLSYMRAYRKKHRQKLKDQAKLLARRPEALARQRLYRKRWMAKQPIEIRRAKKVASENIRRARKRGAAVGDPKQIAAWEKEWRSKPSVNCEWCRKEVSPRNCHTDHILALSRGGAHTLENLCISCCHCNCRKHAKNMNDWVSQLLGHGLSILPPRPQRVRLFCQARNA